MDLQVPKNIYFIGICGTGMAALAAMLKSCGHVVSGSDENAYPPMSTFLAEQQIPVCTGFRAENVKAATPDLVIIGNVLSRGNPEVEYTLNSRLDFLSMPAALSAFFIRGKYSCVVTGTHGKTTTSSMLAWILEAAQQQPSFFIGGIPENFQRGFQLKSGRHFIAEGDEYDSAFFDKGAKFLHYRPDLLIINNVEFDHADIYRNLEEIKTSFRRVINIVPGNGHIIANIDDPVVCELLEKSYSQLYPFGFSQQASWRAQNVRVTQSGTTFEICHRGETLAEVQSALMGKHNVQNTLAAFIAAEVLGISRESTLKAIRTFRGVRRRMTKLAEVKEILVYEDFAHHATAVKETLAGVRARFPERRIWAIFEPRTASAKRKIFESTYYHAFDEADQVIFAAMHRPDKVPDSERLSIPHIIDALRKRKVAARSVAQNEEVLRMLLPEVRRGDVVLFMSNGSFDNIPGRFVEALTKIHNNEV